MVRLTILALAGLIAMATATANAENTQNLTQVNVAKAQAVIDAAVEAYGGSETLSQLKTLVIEGRSIGMAVGQSLKPEPPWDENLTTAVNAIDLGNRVFVTANTGSGGGFEFDNATIINGADYSFALDYRAGLATPVLEPDYDTASGPFIRITPALLVHQLQMRAHTAHYLGEVKHAGSIHDVVGFTMEVGPAISLYFDRASGLLSHSERVLPGFGLVEYGFLDYKKVAGIPFNQRFELHLNGDLNQNRTIINTTVNQPIDNHTTVSAKLQRVAALGPDELSRQEIDDGVYLIGGGGTYAMFIEMADHVIAVGGTAGMPDRIASLREVVADKPLRYGVLTHHHSDHVLAVPTYAEHGAIVIAAAAHAKVVTEAAGEGVDLKLETVNKRKRLSDKSRRVEVIDIGPTAHAEHLLVTWLPDQKILFEADHFAMPRSGPVRPAVSSTQSFAKALSKHKLQPLVLLSAHSPLPGSMTDLQAAIEKKPALIERSAAVE